MFARARVFSLCAHCFVVLTMTLLLCLQSRKLWKVVCPDSEYISNIFRKMDDISRHLRSIALDWAKDCIQAAYPDYQQLSVQMKLKVVNTVKRVFEAQPSMLGYSANDKPPTRYHWPFIAMEQLQKELEQQVGALCCWCCT